jgi:hypothetical protein
MLIFKDIFLSGSNGYISVIVWPRATDNNMVRVESEHVPIEYSVNRLVPSLSYLKVN